MEGDRLIIEADPSTAWRLMGNLWIGDAPPVGYALYRKDFDCVVLMAREYQPGNCFDAISVIHAPIDDGELTKTEAIRAVQAAREVVARLGRGEKVLVTCAAGLNRSALVCALALMFGSSRMRTDDAIALIRMVRSPHALSNPHFVNFLRRVST